jgi:membrane-anchored mycosin MYCP
LADCDAHGTLTASIIAGRPAPTDAFVGVAPDARILSLRQTSDAFSPVGSRPDPNDPNTTQTAGSLRSLARSIVHAANMGAQVINISEAACYKITRPINESGVGAAISRIRRLIPRCPPIHAAGARCRPSSRRRGIRRWS